MARALAEDRAEYIREKELKAEYQAQSEVARNKQTGRTRGGHGRYIRKIKHSLLHCKGSFKRD